jgi:molecular chaperone DnaK (HSP70)
VKAWSQLSAVIVTGGGTRMPMIRKALKKETGVDPEKGINPDEGVAIGALYWGLVARSRANKPTPAPAPKKK